MRLFLFVIAVLFCGASYAQERPSIAIISMDTKDIEMDNDAMANLVRLELEKIDLFEVLDKYDVQETISKNPNPPSNYFGKTAALEAGELLKADKMLTGSVERFGDKIVFILRLVDVKSRKIEKTSVMEYQNVQNEIQTMTMISMNDLLGIENDKHLVDLLIDYDLPITSMRTTMNLNGPRMGMVYVGGENGDRMMDPKSDGGYDMFRVTSMFGYQFEKQYLSSGDFQALIEAVVAVNGLESGMIIPSLSFVNGFRFSKSGFEFGLGPNLRMLQTTEGYFSDGNWIRVRDVEEVPADAKVIERLDRRGDPKLSMGLIVAFGKTFQSGYLNIPFNLYVMPRKDGTMVGVTFGFNTTNRPKL
ncbi:MAG: hypothetical protein CMB89_12930 [Flammeovirgaceae bacterium]|nr:hypothetical protein [Flammeovirgaceae bacterium]